MRARIRGSGRGTVDVAGLEFRPGRIDPYQTGALITQPRSRGSVLLESNHGIVNPGLVTSSDSDGDGKWALVTVDLDRLSETGRRGEDWRSGFRDNPNVILWSDGAVLKSDSVREDRAADKRQALHFRMHAHLGPYVVRISDPGRAVAVSLDGERWKRYDAGAEVELGELAMEDGYVEFWMDACYRDPVSVGPVYFDYVRLTPALHPPAVERIFAAARRKPAQAGRGRAEQRRVPITVHSPRFDGAVLWPARCGLPIPRGDLLRPEQVQILNGAGARLPLQSRSMATWPDGSIRWLFLDFMHDLTASAGNYTMEYGNQISPLAASESVRVSRTDAGLEVDTGAIRFLVSGSRFGILENVTLTSGKSVQHEPVSVEIMEAGGRTWRALESPVTKLELEQSGPLHTTILVETRLPESGKPASGFHHRARIHAYAGSPLVLLC